MNRKVTVVGGAKRGDRGGVAEKQLADVVVIDIADRRRPASRSTSSRRARSTDRIRG
jgi:hypothetical protein